MKQVYLFKLKGESLDLDDLTNLFSEGAWHVFKHPPNSNHYLSIEMDSGLEDQDALAIAEGNLAVIAGVALTQYRSFHLPSIEGICSMDSESGKIVMRAYAYASGGIRFRARAEAEALVKDADGTTRVLKNRTKPYGTRVLKIAFKRDPLQRALFLYGKLPHNWRELYLVLEAIEDGNGGTEKSLLTKSWAKAHVSRIRAFKDTANSFKALKHEARHGGRKGKIDKPLITLTEAQDLAQILLKEWIESLKGR